MPSFSYRGRSSNGQVVSGKLDAINASDAATLLQSQGIIPLGIQAVAEGSAKAADKSAGINKDIIPQKVDHLDIMLFSRQMYTLLKAGVPILRALAGLQESSAKPLMRAMLQELRDSLDAGRELSMALLNKPKIFSAFYVSMIRVGEMTGQLENVFMRLYEHMAFERFMKEQVTSALRYPMFVIIAMAIALTIVNIFVIPAFAKVFEGFNVELPLMTKILLGFSGFMVDWWPVMLGVLVAAIFAFKSWIATHQGRYQWDRIKLQLPIAGKIIKKATLARFARSFAMASKSGVPIIQALSTVAQTVDNEFVGRKLEEMRGGVERGDTVLRTAIATGIFPPVVLQMIAVGEESGTLDDLLQEIADMFQGEIEYELKTLTQQIEPILIVFLGIMVLVLALGIFLPMWDLGKAAIKK